MKKIVLIIVVFLCSCKSGGIDEKGRLEKVRIQIPAFVDIEFEYYKDEENLVKSIPAPFGGYPKLMERTQK
jgi:hypothetical protein